MQVWGSHHGRDRAATAMSNVAMMLFPLIVAADHTVWTSGVRLPREMLAHNAPGCRKRPLHLGINGSPNVCPFSITINARIDRLIIPPEATNAMPLLRHRLGSSLVAVYLHGSAAAGGLRKHSDVDLLAVVDEALPVSERGREGALSLSCHDASNVD